eukprot:4681941-Amphidinium_carterae.1
MFLDRTTGLPGTHKRVPGRVPPTTLNQYCGSAQIVNKGSYSKHTPVCPEVQPKEQTSLHCLHTLLNWGEAPGVSTTPIISRKPRS